MLQDEGWTTFLALSSRTEVTKCLVAVTLCLFLPKNLNYSLIPRLFSVTLNYWGVPGDEAMKIVLTECSNAGRKMVRV